TVAAASTIPTYGRGLIFFPFIDRMTSGFQLRVTTVGPMEVIPNLRRIFAGTYRSPKLRDYAVAGARFELPNGGAYHIGGDLPDPTHGFTVSEASFTVPLLRRP